MLPYDFEPRPTCPRCRRLTRVCWCSGLRPFRVPFDLILLAHPREARNTTGTVRIAHLSVENSDLVIDKAPAFETDPRVLRRVNDPAYFPAVLFPGPTAIDIGAPDVRERIPTGKRLALFVIDGTWTEARGMMRRSKLLQSLPRLAFTPKQPSRYQVRVQPRPYCLSTVEAVHTAINELDRAGLYPAPPESVHDRMLDVFAELVRWQVEFAENRLVRRVGAGTRESDASNGRKSAIRGL